MLSRPSRIQEWDRWNVNAGAAQARRRTEAELRSANTMVKTHERSHFAVAGPYALGAAAYSYVRGPDGQRYAVGGSVRVDVQPVPGDPEATLRKATALMRAAVSSGDPSAADMRVAAAAYRMAAQARKEIEAGKDSTPGHLVSVLA